MTKELLCDALYYAIGGALVGWLVAEIRNWRR